MQRPNTILTRRKSNNDFKLPSLTKPDSTKSTAMRIEDNKNLWTAVAFQQSIMQGLNISLHDDVEKKRKIRSKKPQKKSEIEFNKDGMQDRPILTLAQQVGLEERPPSPLSKEKWKAVEQASKERQSSEHPCPICRDDFGTKQQVLLDCTHSFHLVCLKNFEMFARVKSCPICRKEQYQKKLIQEGLRVHRERCAVRIQSLWKGWRTRRVYKKMILERVPQTEFAKRLFYAVKLESLTDKLIDNIEMERASMERELVSIHHSVQASRKYLSSIEVPKEKVDWPNVKRKAMARKETDCPICISELSLHMTSANSKRTLSTNSREKAIARIANDFVGKVKKVVLLSCTHLFHDRCLSGYEEYSAEEGQMPACPICRCSYQKYIIN
ncbi:RING finger protein [Planoprotostelium fungivorum]|uniref:RING finger protein n=1 Tax=Planoprotostelium fungivorum TaxID=1890364 RepID=A0A2P6NDJ5_9EUKA|nr:RING finger protein [Planoprotostelium fungivorum]